MNYYKIAPGEDAVRWEDCSRENVICVGWSKLRDLKDSKDQDEIANKLEKIYYKNNMSTASLVAKQLWALRGMKNGDIIFANRGKQKVLAMGKVPRGGVYRFDRRWSGSRNDDMPHIVPVVWSRHNPILIRKQMQWQVTIVKLEPELAKYIIHKIKGNRKINTDRQDQIAGVDLDKSPSNERKKQLKLIELRRGQPKFRQMLLSLYEGKCCVSGCDVKDVLEAAHIHAYSDSGANDPKNGLLLRSDLHLLFDLDLLKIHPGTLQVKIAASLIDTEYRDFNDKPLRLPADRKNWPSREWLREKWSI